MKNLFFSILCLMTIALTSCEKNGATISQSYNLSAFSKVSTQCGIDVNLYQGATQSIQLTGADNLLDKVDMYVDNHTLIIKMKPGFYPHNNIVADITLPTIEFVEIEGSGDIWIDDFANLNNLELKIKGSGNIKTGVLALPNHTLDAKISGSGNIEVNGTANVANYTVSGSGNFNCYGLLAGYGHSQISGSGSIEANITTDFYVTISGSGDVYYRGYPTLHIDISGSGKIVDKN